MPTVLQQPFNHRILSCHPFLSPAYKFGTSSAVAYSPLSGAKYDLNDIKKEFKKFEGGQILLDKDDKNGIALICIDFPEKKNGFSGKQL